MTRKIFNAILSVAFFVLISGLVVVTFVLYLYFASIQKSQLMEELQLAASATEQLGLPYLERIKDVDDPSAPSRKNRLTLISPNGEVRFDSHFDSHTMDNHQDRTEVKDALAFGQGSSTRYSSTLTAQTIYFAKKLQDGNVLRISSTYLTPWVLVLGVLQPISIVILLILILSALLAMQMAKQLVEPLNQLNLESPLENDSYEEISPLLRRIHLQQSEIQRQIMELTQKKTEFEQITSNMKESLVLLDVSDKIISINPFATQMFGVDFDCVGKDFLTIERGLDMTNAIAIAKSKGHHSFRQTKRHKEYLFDVSRIETARSHYSGIVILAFDITEQVRAEQSRREFTANISHELKTPLQSIIGSAELLEHGIVKPEDMPRFIGVIQKEATRLVNLIDDVIRLSQLDEGVDMAFEPVFLLDLAKEVCETLKFLADLSDVTLEVYGDQGKMMGIKDLLAKIIYNLCENAIKYNKSGGHVIVSIQQQDNAISLCVADTGIGIPPKHHEKIFERFYRVDKSHSKQTGGTGLGLSIVKHAVQLHNGTISIQSVVNAGTKITVLFSEI